MGNAKGKHMREDDEGLFVIPEESDEFNDLDEPSDELLEEISDALGDTSDLSAARDGIPAKDVPKYLLPSKVYDILKWVGLIFLYALATLLGTLGTAWEWPHTTQIVTSVTAVGFFIGTCLGADEFSARGR